MIDPALQAAIEAKIQTIPMLALVPFASVEYEPGRVHAVVARREEWDGVFESVHGGMLTIIADSAAWLALATLVGPGEVVTTTDLTMRFLAPCLSDIVVDARVIKLGRTLVPLAVDMHDMTGKHIAVSQLSYMRLPGIPARDRAS